MVYRPVLAGKFVQVPPVRQALPGGYLQSPLRQVLPGGLIQVNVDSDPLAGIGAFARWQSTLDGVTPYRLYQDGMLTPAVSAFDPVEVWMDTVSDRLSSESDQNMQPVLNFLGGIPGVEFDGIDDRLVATFESIPQPLTVIVVCTFDDDGTFRRSIDNASTEPSVRCLFGVQSTDTLLQFASGSLGTFTEVIPASNAIWECFYNGASSTVRKNGNLVLSGTDIGSIGLVDGITIGNANQAWNEPLLGMVFATLVFNRAITSDERDLINSTYTSLFNIA